MHSPHIRFHEAANRTYHFVWAELCDWYLELIKPRLKSEEGCRYSGTCTPRI
jgi:valyl-tRNA synthetase